MRPRDRRPDGRARTARGSHQDDRRPSRAGRRLHGRRVLSGGASAGGDVHVVWPGLGQPHHRARVRDDGLLGLRRDHRERAHAAVQPRPLSGDVPPSPGGLSLRDPPVREAHLPGAASRDAAARAATSVQDGGDGAAGARERRRATRRLRRRRAGGRRARSTGVVARDRSPAGAVARDRAARARAARQRPAAGDPRRQRHRAGRGGSGGAPARRAARHPRRQHAAGRRRHAGRSSVGARGRRPQWNVPSQSGHAPGRRPAGARRTLRRPREQRLDSRLHVHDPTHAAHPRRHRLRGDRPQLSGPPRCGRRREELRDRAARPGRGRERSGPPREMAERGGRVAE